jgi:hypothetical protein
MDARLSLLAAVVCGDVATVLPAKTCEGTIWLSLIAPPRVYAHDDAP